MKIKYPINLAGFKFGNWTVLKHLKRRTREGTHLYKAKCICGRICIVRRSGLINGIPGGCGCIRYTNLSKRNFKHGMTKSPEYRIWAAIKARCLNPNVINTHLYGGRGIKLCNAWMISFEQFFKDMGPRPSPKHSIERKDTNGNYEPANCKWATSIEQNNNRRNNRIITVNGESKTLAQWSRSSGIGIGTICYRLCHGWSEQDAVTTNPNFANRRST